MDSLTARQPHCYFFIVYISDPTIAGSSPIDVLLVKARKRRADRLLPSFSAERQAQIHSGRFDRYSSDRIHFASGTGYLTMATMAAGSRNETIC